MGKEGKLDVGIVGYGFAGQLHKEALKQEPRIKNILVMDIDWEKRNQAQAEGLEVHSSLTDLLDKRPDIVITATPPSKNLEIIAQIVNHDPRPQVLLIEKPLATTVADAEMIERLLVSSGVKSMVGLTGHGFHPEFKRTYEIIKSGELGKIHTILENIHLGGPSLPFYYLTKSYGGIVIENGIHTLDHLCFLTDKDNWRVLSAKVGNDHWQQESSDWGEATLATEAQIAHASWLWPKEFEAGLHDYSTIIVGTKGRLTILGFDGIKLQTADGLIEEHFHKPDESLTARHLPGFRAELSALIETISKKEQPPVSVSYAVHLQRLLDQIEKKAIS